MPREAIAIQQAANRLAEILGVTELAKDTRIAVRSNDLLDEIVVVGRLAPYLLVESFVSSTLAPLSAKLADAASAALPYGAVTLGFAEMKANDLAARSRSLKALVEAGVERDVALRLTGFDTE